MAVLTAAVDQLNQAIVGVDKKGTELAKTLLHKIEKRKGRKPLSC